jgi:hypothetical protein
MRSADLLLTVRTIIVYTAAILSGVSQVVHMLKNITLSADDELIARAREEAYKRGTTLNDQFRSWLSEFVERERAAQGYQDLMARLSYVQPGNRFSREELNER